MKLLALLMSLVLTEPLVGQVTQIVIYAEEYLDRRIGKKEKCCVEIRITRNRIVYKVDTIKNSATAKSYMVSTGRNIYNYSAENTDTVDKWKKTRIFKPWIHRIATSDFSNLIQALNTNIDSIKDDGYIVRTSHHHIFVRIYLISKNDTVFYAKTKPFAKGTSWFKDKPSGYIVNPSIDRLIAANLPKAFLCRKELILSPSIDSENED